MLPLRVQAALTWPTPAQSHHEAATGGPCLFSEVIDAFVHGRSIDGFMAELDERQKSLMAVFYRPFLRSTATPLPPVDSERSSTWVNLQTSQLRPECSSLSPAFSAHLHQRQVRQTMKGSLHIPDLMADAGYVRALEEASTISVHKEREWVRHLLPVVNSLIDTAACREVCRISTSSETIRVKVLLGIWLQDTESEQGATWPGGSPHFVEQMRCLAADLAGLYGVVAVRFERAVASLRTFDELVREADYFVARLHFPQQAASGSALLRDYDDNERFDRGQSAPIAALRANHLLADAYRPQDGPKLGPDARCERWQPRL